jgi:hypothetical protein
MYNINYNDGFCHRGDGNQVVFIESHARGGWYHLTMTLVDMVPFSHVKTHFSKPLYNHAHFSHILVGVTHFLVTLCFSKKHHSLMSLSHLLIAQNICKVIFINMIIMGEI